MKSRPKRERRQPLAARRPPTGGHPDAARIAVGKLYEHVEARATRVRQQYPSVIPPGSARYRFPVLDVERRAAALDKHVDVRGGTRRRGPVARSRLPKKVLDPSQLDPHAEALAPLKNLGIHQKPSG